VGSQDTETLVEGIEGESPHEQARRRHAALPDAGRFVRLAGIGGMGLAVLVWDHPVAPGRQVVVKMLLDRLVANARALDRFRRELATHHRLSEQLQVPRLVPCLAFEEGTSAGTAHAVLPFFPDGTLADREAAGTPLRDRLLILADAVEGLQSLHGLGWVHRDVCARNVFVASDGGRLRGLLGDLGVAVPRSANTIFDDDTVVSESAIRVGHAGHIDPRHAGSTAGDLYAVGATLFRQLAGRDAPEEPGPAGLELEVDGLEALPAAMRAAARDALRRLTCGDVSQRFPGAREAREAIAELAALADREEGGHDSPGGRGGRGRLVATTAAAVLLVAAVVVVGGLWSRGENGAPADARLDQPRPVPTIVAPSPTAAPSPEPTSSPAVSVEALVAGARSMVSTGEPDRAVELLREAVGRRPGDVEAAVLLAQLLSRAGPAAADEAAAVLDRALEVRPAAGELRKAAAQLELQRGDPTAALAVLEAAPAGSSYADELEALEVTARRLARRGG